MTKRIYIAIRVKQYQYIFYLKARRVVNLFTDFNAFAWSFLLLAFVLPTIGIGCLAVNDSHSLALPLKQLVQNVFPLSIFEGEKAGEVFGEEPC